MKSSNALVPAFRPLLAAAVSLLAAMAAQAGTLTLTTKADDGGFDGWCSVFWSGAKDDFGPDSKGPVLNAGNLRPTAFDRSATILMFDLSSLKSTKFEEIRSVVLSYYVVEAHGSATLTVTHGTKTEKKLIRVEDNTQKVGSATWTAIGTVSARGKETGSLDVTNSFLADLNAGNAYSSYRIVQAQTYGSKTSTFPFGSRIASSENTSGHAVPTLTITLKSAP